MKNEDTLSEGRTLRTDRNPLQGPNHLHLPETKLKCETHPVLVEDTGGSTCVRVCVCSCVYVYMCVDVRSEGPRTSTGVPLAVNVVTTREDLSVDWNFLKGAK